MPRLLNYGVGEAEKELLFEHLPPLTTEVGGIRRPTAWTITMHEEAEKTELKKANMLAGVIDLRNANAGGIAYENRRRIVAAFSDPGKPDDTGCPEVQGTQPWSSLFYLLLLNSYMCFSSCASDNEDS